MAGCQRDVNHKMTKSSMNVGTKLAKYWASALTRSHDACKVWTCKAAQWTPNTEIRNKIGTLLSGTLKAAEVGSGHGYCFMRFPWVILRKKKKLRHQCCSHSQFGKHSKCTSE